MHPLKKTIARLPRKPGIYVFKTAEGEVVYIGKARSLRDRVKTYFLPDPDVKVRNILAESADVDYILTDSEKEAAFLENNYIQNYQPKYNLRLKDDKSFPYLQLTVGAPYPALYLRRRVEPGGGKYYGPFSPAQEARRTIRLISRFFRLRTCEESVFRNRKRPCLAFDLDLCTAPCVGRIPEAVYAEDVRNARLFLDGRTSELTPILTELMMHASAESRFEDAARWRDLLRTLDAVREKPRVISVAGENADIVGFARKDDRAAVHIFSMRDGKVRSSRESILPIRNEDDARTLAECLSGFVDRSDLPDRILVPFLPPVPGALAGRLSGSAGKTVRILVPRSGRLRKLLDLATRNAEALLRKKEEDTTPPAELARVLALPAPPARIDGFDISNTGGDESVGSMVVFRNGKPDRKEYRKFRIRTVRGPNDVASLEEVLLRRYRRALEEKSELPDLVFVDGGPGQLGAALKATLEAGAGRLPVISLAKKEEILFTPEAPQGIRLPRTSEALKLVQRIRDEAHRFAVSFHRRRREKKSLGSGLEGIPGLGPGKRAILLTRFRSLNRIRSAPMEELAGLVGKKTAEALRKALKDG